MDISVIVPIYRGSKYVPSIMEMVERNIKYASAHGASLEAELLLINDYPAEELVIEKNQELSYECLVFTNSVNSGIHQTRVNGLNKSRGDFILFLDQDDEITDNCLYSQFCSIGDADLVVGNGFRWVNGNYRKIYKSIQKQQLVGNEIIYLKAANQIVSPGHCLIRKTSIPKEWCSTIITDNGGDDMYLWLLMFEKNCKFATNTECVYKHINTGVNLSSDLDAMYKSSDNIIRLARCYGVIDEGKVRKYERRIAFLKQMKSTSGVKKLIVILRNIDIVLLKIYAFYR